MFLLNALVLIEFCFCIDLSFKNRKHRESLQMALLNHESWSLLGQAIKLDLEQSGLWTRKLWFAGCPKGLHWSLLIIIYDRLVICMKSNHKSCFQYVVQNSMQFLPCNHVEWNCRIVTNHVKSNRIIESYHGRVMSFMIKRVTIAILKIRWKYAEHIDYIISTCPCESQEISMIYNCVLYFWLT